MHFLGLSDPLGNDVTIDFRDDAVLLLGLSEDLAGRETVAFSLSDSDDGPAKVAILTRVCWKTLPAHTEDLPSHGSKAVCVKL